MNMANKEILENVLIDDIKPFERNPRKNDAAAKSVAKSIERLGYRTPIIVDENMVILCGHTRHKAIKSLGWTHIPFIVKFTDLTTEQKDEYRILDNKTSEIAEWDFEILTQDFTTDELLDFGFDIKDLPHEDVVEDEAPPVPETPRTVKGDIYQLGNHRVMCGDSTIITDVEKLMDGKKADMVFTDPPYGMFLDADFSGMKNNLKFMQEKGIMNGKKYNNVIGDNKDFKPEFISTVFSMFGYCKEIFLWGADYYSDLLPDKNSGSWVVWDKRLEESADKMYGSCFELCWSKAKHKRMIARVKWAGAFGTEKEFDHKRFHPTQKPQALVKWFFDYYSLQDKKIVADIFLGSGTTLIACEQTNRICYGMELDEKYCDVIVQRWVNLTGGKVILNGNEVEWKKTEQKNG